MADDDGSQHRQRRRPALRSSSGLCPPSRLDCSRNHAMLLVRSAASSVYQTVPPENVVADDVELRRNGVSPARHHQCRPSHEVRAQQTEHGRECGVPLQDHHRADDAESHTAGATGRSQSRLQNPEHNDRSGNAGEPSGGLSLKRNGEIWTGFELCIREAIVPPLHLGALTGERHRHNRRSVDQSPPVSAVSATTASWIQSSGSVS